MFQSWAHITILKLDENKNEPLENIYLYSKHKFLGQPGLYPKNWDCRTNFQERTCGSGLGVLSSKSSILVVSLSICVRNLNHIYVAVVSSCSCRRAIFSVLLRYFIDIQIADLLNVDIQIVDKECRHYKFS
jgi:hypothetical protein